MHLLSSEEHNVSLLTLTLRFCMSVSVLAFNAAEIWILFRSQRKTFQVILISLSVADLLVGISSVFDCFATIYHWQRASKLISIFSFYYFMLVSILHLVFISLDRLCAVAFPLRHRTWNTRKKLLLGLLISWLLPVLTLACQFLINYSLGSSGWESIHGFDFDSCYWLNVLIAVADIFFISIYATIYYLIRRSKTPGCQVRNESESTKKKQTLLLCIFTVLAFMACMSPFLVAHITEWNKPDWLGSLYRNTLIANSAINAIIFLVQHAIQTKVLCTIIAKRRKMASEIAEPDIAVENINADHETEEQLNLQMS